MAVTITLHPGLVLTDTVSVALLNQMWEQAHGTIDTGQVDTDTVADEAITLAKTADLTRGSLISGQTSSNRPTALDASGDAKILIGDGDDLNSVSVTGGVSIDNAGVVTIQGDTQTVITETPTYVGQLAYVDGAFYIANSTADSDGWGFPRWDASQFEEQAADVSGTAEKITVFCKDSGSQLDLYYIRGTGSAVQLTGTTGTALAGGGAPDWDSGWTKCNHDVAYDLTSVALEAFSDVTKGDAATGETNAGGVLNFVDYRLAKLHIKMVGANPFTDFITFIGNIPGRYNGWGAQIITAGGTFPTFDTTLPGGGWDDSTAKLYLRTGSSGIWLFSSATTPAATADWDEKTNKTLGDGVDEALLRIQLWQ